MRIILANIEEDIVMVTAAPISAIETKCIDNHGSSANTFAKVTTRPEFDKIPVDLDVVRAVLGNISHLFWILLP